MRCSVFGCDVNNSTGNCDDISFHRFPSDAKICKTWVLLCRRQGKFNINTARVCSKHFKPEDFIAPNPIFAQHGMKVNAQLKRDVGVVPSLFLQLPKPTSLAAPRSERKQKRDLKSSSTVYKTQRESTSEIDARMTTIAQHSSTANSYCQTEPSVVRKINCSTQTNSYTDSLLQLQEEVVELRKKFSEQQKLINSLHQNFTNGQLQKLQNPEKRETLPNP